MPKTKISEFDIDPANNTDINSINIAEGCAPSGINNAIRQLMSDLKEFQTGAGGDPFNGAVNGTVGATTPNTGAFTTLSASGAFSANGGATLGDASGDALTINSSAVSIPNGLNFDSNTFVIDATNNRVGIGTSSVGAKLQVNGSGGGQLFIDNAGSGANYYDAITHYFRGTSGTGDWVIINSSGNVGIGTAIPASYRLTIENNGAQLRVRNSTTRYRSDYTVGSDGSTYINSYDDVGGVYKAMNLDGNPIKFNANGTESMRIDSSGNVGIGTSSPTTKLQVTGTVYSDNNGLNCFLLNSAGSYYGSIQNDAADKWSLGYAAASGSLGTPVLTWNSSGNVGIGTSSPSTTLHVSSANNPAVIINRSVSTGDAAITLQSTGTNVAKITGLYGGGFTFATGSGDTERMRIDSSGNLLVGTTSVNNAGVISIDFNGQSKQGITLDDTYASTGGAYLLFRNSSGDTAGVISHNGTTTVAYTTSSDYRLKENVAPMTGALATVSALKPVTYTWKADGSNGQGFIAHELQAVVPDCVVGEKDAVDADGNPVYQGIDTSFLVATLTAAIQELKAEVDSLKAQLNK